MRLLPRATELPVLERRALGAAITAVLPTLVAMSQVSLSVRMAIACLRGDGAGEICSSVIS